ncbi:MAG TPA: 50S ribosome-binding GTPase [Candidatus Ozemobacteraceae bacterium]|nr:50S ribosome-binding GTPase [Candidatus Ozemobacteraceae bacterium]
MESATSSAPAGQVTAAGLRSLIGTAQSLWGRPAAADAAEAHRLLALLEKREKSVCDCLLTVIAGGTKVGKTTLINALAGREISSASARACSTLRPSVYAHQRRAGMARRLLEGILEPSDAFFSHDEAALEHLILVDTPDLDGIREENRQVFARLLERADLVLCVVTTQKYDSLDLYAVLGSSMGFRRAVFVLNRIDEGMLTPREQDDVIADLRKKIGALPLRTPLGEELPVFRISAHNAFLAKTGQGGGPRWDFPKLEEYLRARLDQTVAARINAENQAERASETAAWIERVCRLEPARGVTAELRSWSEAFARQSRDTLRNAAASAVGTMSADLVRRRESEAAARLGGPFGAYVRTSLAISTLATRLQSLVISPFSDPVTPLAERLSADAGTAADALLLQGRRHLTELLDRAGLDPAPLNARLEATPPRALTTGRIAERIRAFLEVPEPGRAVTLLLNALPLLIILLLVRYFLTALMAAHDPAAGMFIGGGLLFWLVCHLQAGFWLSRQSCALEGLTGSVEEQFSAELRRRLIDPALTWADEVDQAGR